MREDEVLCAMDFEAFFKAAKKKDFNVNAKDNTGKTATHYAFAAETYQYEEMTPPFTLHKFSTTVEVILKHAKELEIDLEATEWQGRTPLHYLYETKPKEHVEWFLEFAKKDFGIEFNVNAWDHKGKTPKQLAK